MPPTTSVPDRAEVLRPDNAPALYGRKPEIGELVKRVRRNPVTILYGSSGFGKTSLIGAGLIPELESLGYLPVEIKLQFLQADPAQARQIWPSR